MNNKKTNVIRNLGAVTLEKLKDFLDGNIEFPSIRLDDSEYFSIIKTANETTFQPSLTFAITSQDHRIEFSCTHWKKPDLCDKHEKNSQLKKVGELWKEYPTPLHLTNEALVWFRRDDVLEVFIQKVIPEGDIVPSYGLLVRSIK